MEPGIDGGEGGGKFNISAKFSHISSPSQKFHSLCPHLVVLAADISIPADFALLAFPVRNWLHFRFSLQLY